MNFLNLIEYSYMTNFLTGHFNKILILGFLLFSLLYFSSLFLFFSLIIKRYNVRFFNV